MYSLKSLDESCAHLLLYHLCRLCTLHYELHVLLRYVVLFLRLCRVDVPVSLDILLLVGRNGEYSLCVTRNSVVQLTTVELHQSQSVALLCLVQESCHQLYTVSTLLVYVVTRVSADKTLYLGAHEEHSLWCLFLLEAEGSRSVPAAGTADKYLSFVLRVQVHQHVASHKSWFHTLCTRQSRLLVACEYALQRSVFYVVSVEYRQLYGTAYTVVGTQCGTLGTHPLAVNISLYGVLVEVEVHVNKFLAHHIHVALQNQGRAVLVTLRGRLTYQHVTRLIHLRLKTATFSEFTQKLYHFLFLLRWARNLVDSRKLLEHASRLQFYVAHTSFIFMFVS